MHRPERRRAPRVPVAVVVEQRVGRHTHRSFASDLSLSGLYMERPLDVFVRDRATIELAVWLTEDAEPVRAEAEIVYDHVGFAVHGTAVRFTRMSARDRARLGAFLRAPRACSQPALAAD